MNGIRSEIWKMERGGKIEENKNQERIEKVHGREKKTENERREMQKQTKECKKKELPNK